MTKMKLFLALLLGLSLMLGTIALAEENVPEDEVVQGSMFFERFGYASDTQPVISTSAPAVEEPVLSEAPAAEPVAEPVAKPVSAPEEASAYTARGEAALREAADGLSPIIVLLADGAPVELIAVEGDWAYVNADGVTGYIYLDDLNGIARPESPELTAFKVTIFTSRTAVMTPGQEVVLTSRLEGFEGYEVVYQWEYDRGEGFEAVPGGDQASYTFEASIETLAYDWRLTVYAYPMADAE